MTQNPPAPELPASLRVIERGWLSSNNILLFDGDEATLIDSGYVGHAAQTVELVREALAACGEAAIRTAGKIDAPRNARAQRAHRLPRPGAGGGGWGAGAVTQPSSPSHP